MEGSQALRYKPAVFETPFENESTTSSSSCLQPSLSPSLPEIFFLVYKMGQWLNDLCKIPSARFLQFLLYISLSLSKYNLESATVDSKIMLGKIKANIIG